MGFAYSAAVWENDRTRAATEIKLNSFNFASAAREQNANKQKLNISELGNRSVWKKPIYYLYTTPPPPSGISWTLDYPTPLEFPIPSVGEVWIFSGTTQSNFSASLSLVLIKQILGEIQPFKNLKNLLRHVWKTGQIVCYVWRTQTPTV